MSAVPLKETLPNEHILKVEPTMNLFVDAKWRRRANLYPGRALSADALLAEQEVRAGRLALRGQAVSPGVVSGLEVRLEKVNETASGTWDECYVHIGAGMGVAANGQDVVIPRPLRLSLTDIPAWEMKKG